MKRYVKTKYGTSTILICKKCGSVMKREEGNASFCPVCGFKGCTFCGEELETDSVFCDSCGSINVLGRV